MKQASVADGRTIGQPAATAKAPYCTIFTFVWTRLRWFPPKAFCVVLSLCCHGLVLGSNKLAS